MESKIIELDKQVKKAFVAVKKDISELMQFKEGMSKATIKNKKIFSDIVKTINEKIVDISEKLNEIDTNIKTFDSSMKKLNDEIYKNDVDVQKLKVQSAKIERFKNAVNKQEEIKKDLLKIANKFEASFKDTEEIKKLFKGIEKDNTKAVQEFTKKMTAYEKEKEDSLKKVDDKSKEIDLFLNTVNEKIKTFDNEYINKTEFNKETKRVEKALFGELDVMYSKNIKTLEKQFSQLSDELAKSRIENDNLKKHLTTLNAQLVTVANDTVSKKSFVKFQQENFNNVVKITESIKEMFNKTTDKIINRFKQFLKENDAVTDGLYNEISTLKRASIDKSKFNKEVEKLNKTLYKYYKANLEITKLDVAYSDAETKRNKGFFEKLFSYEELDGHKNNIDNVSVKPPKVEIKPVEIKTSSKLVKDMAIEETTLTIQEPREKGGFKRFLSNIFFEEIEDTETKQKSIDDKLVDLTEKVEVEEKKSTKVEEKKAVKSQKKKTATKKPVKKKTTTKKTSTKKKANKKGKKKAHEKLYMDLDNSNKEVINLYDDE